MNLPSWLPRWRKQEPTSPSTSACTIQPRRWPLVVCVLSALALFGLLGGRYKASQPQPSAESPTAAPPLTTPTAMLRSTGVASAAMSRSADQRASSTTLPVSSLATSTSIVSSETSITLPIKLANAFKRKLVPREVGQTTATSAVLIESAAAASPPGSFTPVGAGTRYRPSLTLNEYLEQQLGSKYHPRTEWAGHRSGFLPVHDDVRTWEPIGTVQFITVHHASGVPNEHPARMIRNIFIGHTDANGRLDASDVGYHFFVDGDGEVWAGRDARRMGTHVGSKPHGLNNEGNLGICGLGSYAHDYPPGKMVDGIVNLSLLICKYYGWPLTIRGHKDWQGIHGYNPLGGTDCPGRLERAVLRTRSRENDLWPKASQKAEKSKSTKRVAQRDDGGKARAARKPAEPSTKAAPTARGKS